MGTGADGDPHAFLIWMFVYCFIFSPIRWIFIGIQTGDWSGDNCDRALPKRRPGCRNGRPTVGQIGLRANVQRASHGMK